MGKAQRPVVLVGILALATALAGCGSSRSADDSAQGGGGESGSFTVDTGACPPDATQGLAEGEPIKLGASLPMSGQFASGGKTTATGLRVVFEKVNENGGINGHPIELVVRDDAYDPSRAVTNAKAFISQDNVFANVVQQNTTSVTATQPLWEEACIPQLWTIAASAQLGNPESHPWTTGGIMPAVGEARIVARYIAEQQTGADVTEITMTNELGQSFSKAFTKAASEQGLNLLPSHEVAPDAANIDSQITAALSQNPDAIFGEVAGPFCSQFLTRLAQGGFDGIAVLSSACNSAQQYFTPVDPAGDGVATVMMRQDPSDPRYSENSAMQQYKQDVQRFAPDQDPGVARVLDGYTFGQVIVENLRAAAKMDGGLTRANLMNAAWNTTVQRPLMLKPMGKVQGGADPYLVEYGEVHTYNAEKGGWEKAAEYDLEGQLGRYTGN